MAHAFRIGTRGSKLALWQANYVAGLLREARPGLSVEVVVVKTKGDKILDVALSKIGDKGLFTKELEAQLLAGEVDVCVHSCKDMPTLLPDGLVLAAMPPRAEACDCIVAPKRGLDLASIPAGARVATGSLRRTAQLRRLRPDVEVCDIRGNVDTRIAKVESGEFDCAVLAEAGIRRLGLDEHISSVVPPQTMIPAVGQGAVVVEARAADEEVLDACRAIADAPTMRAVEAERVVLAELEGGCQVPLGAHARFVPGTAAGAGVASGAGEGDAPAGPDAPAAAGEAGAAGEKLVLDAFVSSLDGSRFVPVRVEGAPKEAQALAMQAVERLRAGGAEEILEELR